MRPIAKAVRKISSDRGSVYLEYALLTALVLIGAIAALRPGSVIYKNIGRDFVVRSIVMKLPLL